MKLPIEMPEIGFSYLRFLFETQARLSIYLAPDEMFANMLQLMRFSVYFKGILNINNG